MSLDADAHEHVSIDGAARRRGRTWTSPRAARPSEDHGARRRLRLRDVTRGLRTGDVRSNHTAASSSSARRRPSAPERAREGGGERSRRGRRPRRPGGDGGAAAPAVQPHSFVEGQSADPRSRALEHRQRQNEISAVDKEVERYRERRGGGGAVGGAEAASPSVGPASRLLRPSALRHRPSRRRSGSRSPASTATTTARSYSC